MWPRDGSCQKCCLCYCLDEIQIECVAGGREVRGKGGKERGGGDKVM